MRTATIEEAKEHLAELIAAARAGEEVRITDEAGTVMAQLEPCVTSVEYEDRHLPPPTETSEELIERYRRAQPTPEEARESLDRLVADGVVIPAKKRKSDLGELPAGPASLRLLDALLEERQTGR